MEILRTISFYIKGKDKPFVVIGGHALNALGLNRHTGDIDLLVRSDDKDFWIKLLKELRYETSQVDKYFARFRASDYSSWPIDLMFVDSATFDNFYSKAKLVDFGLSEAPVASVEHLIALKLHALKAYQEHRDAKDFSDLLYLIKISKLDKQQLKLACDRHGNDDLWQRIIGAITLG